MEGRTIHDNILVAFELLHAMKNRRQEKVGDIALKIDISKAYDRVDWVFFRQILLSWASRNCGCF